VTQALCFAVVPGPLCALNGGLKQRKAAPPGGQLVQCAAVTPPQRRVQDATAKPFTNDTNPPQFAIYRPKLALPKPKYAITTNQRSCHQIYNPFFFNVYRVPVLNIKTKTKRVPNDILWLG